MGLQKFEQRLERLVEGAFAKAFRTGLQPVELGRRLVREMDQRRTLGVRGTIVPNRFTFEVNPTDLERFAPFEQTLVAELIDTARQHAKDQSYRFVGTVLVSLGADDTIPGGTFRLTSGVVEAGLEATIVLADGTRIAVGDSPMVAGRSSDCDLVLADPTVSKRHIEFRRQGSDVVLVDLGSTNGTTVNGVRIRDRVLTDGDEIRLGATVLHFEAA